MARFAIPAGRRSDKPLGKKPRASPRGTKASVYLGGHAAETMPPLRRGMRSSRRFPLFRKQVSSPRSMSGVRSTASRKRSRQRQAAPGSTPRRRLHDPLVRRNFADGWSAFLQAGRRRTGNGACSARMLCRRQPRPSRRNNAVPRPHRVRSRPPRLAAKAPTALQCAASRDSPTRDNQSRSRACFAGSPKPYPLQIEPKKFRIPESLFQDAAQKSLRKAFGDYVPAAPRLSTSLRETGESTLRISRGNLTILSSARDRVRFLEARSGIRIPAS